MCWPHLEGGDPQVPLLFPALSIPVRGGASEPAAVRGDAGPRRVLLAQLDGLSLRSATWLR